MSISRVHEHKKSDNIWKVRSEIVFMRMTKA